MVCPDSPSVKSTWVSSTDKKFPPLTFVTLNSTVEIVWLVSSLLLPSKPSVTDADSNRAIASEPSTSVGFFAVAVNVGAWFTAGNVKVDAYRSSLTDSLLSVVLPVSVTLTSRISRGVDNVELDADAVVL